MGPNASFFNPDIHTDLRKTRIIFSKPGLHRAFLLLIFTGISVSYSEAAVFIIKAPGSDSIRVHDNLNYHLEKITNMLGIEYPDTVRVVIAADRLSFNRALGSTFPDWGAAAAIKKERLIVIKSPAHFRVGKSLEELLGHELGHLIIDKASGGKWLPRWFEEGFCQLVSGEWRLSNDIRVTWAVWGSGLIPLTALEEVNKFGGAKAALAYAQSYLAISALVQELGIEFIPGFLAYYRDSGNIYKAFFRASGYEYSEWVNIWQKKTADRYRFVLYIFDSSVLFPLIAVLLVLLYLLKMYQVSKKKKLWREEERL